MKTCGSTMRQKRNKHHTPCMRMHTLYNVKQKRLGNCIHFEMCHHGNEHSAIRRHPCIGCKVQGIIIHLCFNLASGWVAEKVSLPLTWLLFEIACEQIPVLYLKKWSLAKGVGT